MEEDKIIESVNWAIDVNTITKEISGENCSINVNVLHGLLDLYYKEKSRKSKIINKLKGIRKGENCGHCNNACNKYMTCTTLEELLEGE